MQVKIDTKKLRRINDIISNILSFVVIFLTAKVIFAIDHRFPESNEMAKFVKIISIIPIISASGFFLFLVKRSIKFSLLDLFSLLFFVYYLILAFVSGSGDPKHILLPIFLLSIYVIVRVIASNNDYGLKWCALAILLVSIFELTLGIKQMYGLVASNHLRGSITGSFFNPGPFGGYLAFIFALSLSVLVKMRVNIEILISAVKLRQFKRIISIDILLYFVSFAVLILSLILLPSTMSRSAWMSVCFVSLIAIIQSGAVKKTLCKLSSHKYLLMSLALMVTVLVAISIYGIYTLKEGSADARFFSWRISTKVIFADPIVGVGPGHFEGAYAIRQAQYFSENPDSKYIYIADCPDYAFNEYLQMGAELGLVGLVLFTSIIILALRNVKSNPLQYGSIAILCYYLLSISHSSIVGFICYFYCCSEKYSVIWTTYRQNTIHGHICYSIYRMDSSTTTGG